MAAPRAAQSRGATLEVCVLRVPFASDILCWGMRTRDFIRVLSLAFIAACGGDDTGEQTSQACKAASDCYPGIDSKLLKGDAVCLDRVTNGYCTHLCTQDSDCCAVTGECTTGHPQVCAPFESTGQKYCFLSCEASIVTDAKSADGTTYCTTYANPAFGCRSTGGGSENRKVCMP